MSKVLVERPRAWRWQPNWTVRRDRRSNRADDWDALPSRRGMRPRHGSRSDLNENLAPLIRFLRSRCGKPWDRVYSELRATLDVRSAVQKHIFEHLEDFVALHAAWRDGVLYDTNWRWGWRPIRRSGHQFYVDPKTGILREPKPQRDRAEVCVPHRRRIDGQLYVRYGTTWNAVRLRRLPMRWVRTRRYQGHYVVDYARFDGDGGVRDLLLKARASLENEAERAALYGEGELIAVWRRPLNRRELKQLGLWRT